jgi:hypothetical protein
MPNVPRTPKGKRPLGRPGSRWKDAIQNITNRIYGCELGSSGSGYGQVTGSYDTVIAPLDFIKLEEFLDQLSEY